MFINHFRKTKTNIKWGWFKATVELKTYRPPGRINPITSADFQHVRSVAWNGRFTTRHLLPVPEWLWLYLRLVRTRNGSRWGFSDELITQHFHDCRNAGNQRHNCGERHQTFPHAPHLKFDHFISLHAENGLGYVMISSLLFTLETPQARFGNWRNTSFLRKWLVLSKAQTEPRSAGVRRGSRNPAGVGRQQGKGHVCAFCGQAEG